MKKLFLSLILLLIFATPCFGATFHAAQSGGWRTAATWAENSGYPVAGDTVIFDAGSAGVTVTLAESNACAVIDMTGNTTGVLAMGGYSITVTGNITLAGSGSNVTGTTGYILNNGSNTITCNSIALPNIMFMAPSGTVTLGSDLVVTGTIKYAAITTMAGAYDISCGTLTSAYNITLVTGQDLTISTAIALGSNYFGALTIASSTGTATNLIYNGTAANSKIAGVTFTNVTVTGTGASIYNWFGSGTNTGITNVTNSDVSSGSGGGSWGF